MNNIIQKICDFFAHPFSKHDRRVRRLERCSCDYPTVDAKILMAICNSINPPYSHLVNLSRSVLGSGGGNTFMYKVGGGGEVDGGDFFDDPRLAEVFYDNRERFLSKKYLNRVIGDIPDSFHEHLINTYSSAKEEGAFRSMAAAAGLLEHVLLSEDNIGRKTIELKEINVQGKIELNLGGKFGHWMFNRVNFDDETTINIFPSACRYRSARMDFNESICRDMFACLYGAVPEIYINDSIFMSGVCVDAPKNTPHNGEAVSEWIAKMIDTCYQSPCVEFSNNYIKGAVCLYPGDEFRSKPDGLGDIHFLKGNYIGRLYAGSSLWPTDDDSAKNNSEHPWIYPAKIRNFFFSGWEHIAWSSDPTEAQGCKDFFIAWKNHAKKTGDDEGARRYAIQERYFDRMRGRNRLAKLPPWLGDKLPALLLRLLNKILPSN